MGATTRCVSRSGSALITLAVLSAIAEAQAVAEFNLPSQPLAEALRAVASQTNSNILFERSLVSGRSAPPLQATLSVDEALNTLLRGTDLTWRFVDEKTVTIIAAASDAPGSSSGASEAHKARTNMETADYPAGRGAGIRIARAQQGAAATPAERERDATDDKSTRESLEEVVVRAVSFRYEEVMSANKMPMSVKDTPQSVKVVTEDLFDFAGIRKFEDLYRIDASSGTSHAGDQYPRNYYRGFIQQGINAIKVDGFRMTAELQLDLAPFERFEVVKGATSTLYGQNPIAGTLNAVSKLPQDSFGGAMSLEVGSYEHYRGELDFYGPLSADGALSYRLVGAYLDEQSYLDFVSDRRWVLAPSLRYEFSPNTSLLARVTYQDADFTPYYGLGAQFLGDDIEDPAQLIPENFRIPDVPRSRTGNAPDIAAQKEVLFVQTMLEHGFEGGWRLRGNLQYTRSKEDQRGILMFGFDRDGLLDADFPYLSDAEDEAYGAEVNLFGDVEAFGRTHTLFVGADYAVLDSDEVVPYTFRTDTGFNILDPDYSLLPIPAGIEDYVEVFGTRDKRKLGGVTAQALLRPLDALTVSLGARYSRDINRSVVTCCELGAPSSPAERLEEEAVTFQAGLTYAATDQLNLYASYGESFEPQTGFVAEGAPIDPEEGLAYEVGLKGEALGRQLSYSMALFHMERTNIAQSLLGTPFVVPVGTQRSRGVELDFQGETAPGWDVYGSIAWLDAEYTEGEFEGARPANAPEFGLSLFTSYEIQGGALQGLGIGGGVVHKSGLDTADIIGYGALTPITLTDDFTEVDLRLFYTRADWQFELAATNLLDEKYYSNAFGGLNEGFQVNPPRQVMGTVRYRF